MTAGEPARRARRQPLAELGGILRAARRRAELSQTQVAQALGLTQSVVSTRETGRSDMPTAELQRFVDLTRQPLVLAPGQGWSILAVPPPVQPNPRRDQDPERSVMVPVLGLGSAGPGVLNDPTDAGELDLAEEWYRHIDGMVRVRGDSMQPLLYDGDWVGVRLGEEHHQGDIVVASVGFDGEVVIKVWWGMLDDRAVLQSVNPSFGHVVCRPEDVTVHGLAYGLMRPRALRLP